MLADTQASPPNVVSTTASTSNEPTIATTKEKSEPKSHRIFVPSVDVVDAFGRVVHENNGVKYVIGRKGDSYHELSQELNLGYWQLPKYNETDEDAPIKEGQYIYIQPKKKEGQQTFYIAKDGDTVESISSVTAVKASSIRKFNNLEEKSGIQAGQKILLRKE
ncbi:MAG: LysM peptidoglycan-binding domain-containing protein [Bacteroidetes bacterium]|nr:LysM peptidoglycan-binding domain-containing protein [Bacteroidota bacterium]